MTKVSFLTPTKLSLMDMTSMGDSSKRGDDTKIGVFDSGLKYSLALMLRNNVNFKAVIFENYNVLAEYTTKTVVVQDDLSGKEKEIICVVDSLTDVTTQTSFAKNLGWNWEPWMILRELWSNMVDEGGYCEENEMGIEKGTRITLEFDESSPFFDVWKNKHLYINESKDSFRVSSSVEAIPNKDLFLRIYKQNILVYQDKETSSQFSYNIKFGEIDERRILSNLHNVKANIGNAILQTDNSEFINKIIGSNFDVPENDFLLKVDGLYASCSETLTDAIYACQEEYGRVQTYSFILNSVRKRSDCTLANKKITTVEDSIWDYSTEVTVETPVKEAPSVDQSFSERINALFKFDLDVDVKESKLKGAKVVADKHNECLIVCPSFDTERDFAELLVQYIDLTQEGNIITNLSNYVKELLRK